VIYRRRASPLHSARAAAGCAYCLALAVVALVFSHPVILLGVIASVSLAGAAAGVGRDVFRTAAYAVPLAVAITAINALVTRNGVTVILRLGDLPVLGQTDVTLQATVYGAILGLRAIAVLMCGALYTAAIDPDEVLRMMRRVSFRSALTASLATRMVPVLMRDSRRLAEAQRCRAAGPPSRVALLRASTAGVLDRALDVAAVLELRGYAGAQRPPRARAPWGRHDLNFALAAAMILAGTIVVRVAGWAPFSAYPRLQWSLGPAAWLVFAGLLLASGLPFCERRGMVW
jgi:energy-coupling factor transport system permease protein